VNKQVMIITLPRQLEICTILNTITVWVSYSSLPEMYVSQDILKLCAEFRFRYRTCQRTRDYVD